MSGPLHVSPISFGHWLKQRRREAGITRDDLADRTACSSETLQKIENGERRPSRQIALGLAELFHVPADEQEAFVTFALALRPRDTVSASPTAASQGAPHLEAETNEPEQEQAHSDSPWRAVHLNKSNLPLMLTTLIGREQEQDTVCSRLRQPKVRLLTLTGPPGTGKTRLSIEVAAALLGDFEDGVYLAELAPLSDPDMVIPSIARTLDLRETGGQTLEQTLLAYIKDKRMLLVLDNFEHLLDAGPDVVKLIQASPWLKVLVTSREALHVRGERQYAVPALRLPVPADRPGFEELSHNPAVQLFVERAEDAEPDFALTSENALEVAEVCINLDGLPLAIELAAARVSLFPPRTLLTRLGQQLELLTGGQRDLPPRQRTLRAAIDWSYDLLDEGHQQLFSRMAVFQGGRTLAGLEAVCNLEGVAAEGKKQNVESLPGVETLLSSNLLQQREGRDGEPRYWMLETIHEYAREKLEEGGEVDVLQKEHALYFMRLAEEAEPHLTGEKQQKWLTRLEDEHDNFRAALRWAASASVEEYARLEIGLLIAGHLATFWDRRGHFTEGRVTLALLLGHPALGECTEQARACAYLGAGVLAFRQPDLATARRYLETALALARAIGDRRVVAFSLLFLGDVVQQQGDYPGAQNFYQQCLDVEYLPARSGGLLQMGRILCFQGDADRGREALQESLRVGREFGDKHQMALLLRNIGNVAWFQANYREAADLYAQSLDLAQELNNEYDIAWSLVALGHVAWLQGDYDRARNLYARALSLANELGVQIIVLSVLVGLGNVLSSMGEHAEALAVCRRLMQMAQESGSKPRLASAHHTCGHVHFAAGDYAVAREHYTQNIAINREVGDIRDTGYSLLGLGHVAYIEDDYSLARCYYSDGLSRLRELDEKRGTALGLSGMAAVLAAEGSPQRSARLFGAAARLLESIGIVFDAPDRIVYERGVACARTCLGDEAFEGAWQEGQAMSMEEAIGYALESVSAS